MNYATDELTDVTYTTPLMTHERAQELMHEGRIWKDDSKVEPDDFDRKPLQWVELRQLLMSYLHVSGSFGVVRDGLSPCRRDERTVDDDES